MKKIKLNKDNIENLLEESDIVYCYDNIQNKLKYKSILLKKITNKEKYFKHFKLYKNNNFTIIKNFYFTNLSFQMYSYYVLKDDEKN